MLASLFAIAFGATAVFALPHGLPRAEDTCQTTVGTNAYGTMGPFTLAAINKTDAVLARAGVPLHLSPSVSDAGNRTRSLATNETYPASEFPEFRLVHGGLVAPKNASESGLSAAASDIDAGSPFSFEVSHSQLAPAPVFCAVVGTSPAGGNPVYPLLALHGDTQSFSLCQARSRAGDIPLDVVVYQPSASRSDEYAFESCYPVFVQLVPTEPY